MEENGAGKGKKGKVGWRNLSSISIFDFRG